MNRKNRLPKKGDGYHVAIAIIRYQNNILLTRRNDPESPWHDFWEFPGGGVEADETIDMALQREIFEEVGMQIGIGDYVYMKTYMYTGNKTTKSIYLHVYSIQCKDEPKIVLDPLESSAYEWVEVSEVAHYPGLLPQNIEMIDDYISADI
ncbi:MAG: NUDIX domain-containing protein [Candidatus Kerfeldbacteria bacterium]|nr:NUDIX domain-containing protein [Candidatus Kerfeldbacteria bacterium]